MDSEWILALTEEEQIMVAEVVSAREQGIDLNPAQMDEVYRLLGGGSRGTAAGAFESLEAGDGSADEDSDGEGEEDPTKLGTAGAAGKSATPATPVPKADATKPRAAGATGKSATPATPVPASQKLLSSFFKTSQEKTVGPGRGGGGESKQQNCTGRQQDHTGRQRDQTGRQQDHKGRQQDHTREAEKQGILNPVEMYRKVRSLVAPVKAREKLREFSLTEAEPLPPVFCMLCEWNCMCVEGVRHPH